MSEHTRVIILAAGQGTRLRPLTEKTPKCLIQFQGMSLLDRQAEIFQGAGINDITVVCGFCAEEVIKKGYDHVINEKYDCTNMVHTLFCADHLMKDDKDLVVSYGDIVFEETVLQSLLDCNASICVSVDKMWRRYWEKRMSNPLEDAESLKFGKEDHIRELGKKASAYDEIQGQYMGLIKISKDSIPQVKKIYKKMDKNVEYDGKDFKNMYMTSFIQHLINIGIPVKAAIVKNGWLEFDSLEDLEVYSKLQKSGELSQFYDYKIT